MAEKQESINGFSNGSKRKADPITGLKEGQSVYSHSRLATFEQCPLKFKYAYLDKLESEIEGSIESFLGSRVHEALEKLYTDLKFEKLNTVEELIEYFNQEWEKHWTDNILIVRAEYTTDNFKAMGERFIKDYYKRYFPFNHSRTIGLESRIVIKLDSEGKYVLQGYIDRLSDAGDGVYEIHDYKTANSLPEQDKIDVDRQLALYAIAIKEQYKDCKKVVLIWHYLAFDKELRSERTDLQLQKLREDTIALIKKVEATREFPPQESALCKWCEFRPICPRWKHEYETEKLTPEEYKKEDGVKMVNEYVALKEKEKELNSQLEKLNLKIIDFAEKMNADRVFGSDSRATIWKKNCVKFPSKTEIGYAEIIKELRDSNALEDFSTLDKWKLEKAFEEIDMDPKLMEKIAKYGRREVLKKIYLSKR